MKNENIRIGAISRRDAEWLGNAAMVAGGWVMVPWGPSRVDSLLGPDEILAAIPETFRVRVRPVNITLVVDALRDDVEVCSRFKCLEEFVPIARHWLAKIHTLIGPR